MSTPGVCVHVADVTCTRESGVPQSIVSSSPILVFWIMMAVMYSNMYSNTLTSPSCHYSEYHCPHLILSLRVAQTGRPVDECQITVYIFL